MIDILYLAWNRLEFSRATFAALLANTDWSLVRQLLVFDDGSEDGTREFLDGAIRACPVEAHLAHAGWRSPPAVMNHYCSSAREMVVPMFAKVDNDIAVPAGWLAALLSVMEADSRVDLLGMEAGMVEVAGRDGGDWDGTYRFQPATHIGGVGLMRVRAFRRRRAIAANGRHGFTNWQHDHPELVRGWIAPDLACPQLDRIPAEPWLSLSEEYGRRGWQRRWPKYDPAAMNWSYSWLAGLVPA